MNILYVLTSTFPFGKGETFIDNEVEYWNSFDKIFVCHSSNESIPRYVLPKDVEIIKLPNWKNIFSVSRIKNAIKRQEFKTELKKIINTKVFLFRRLFSLIAWTVYGELIFNHLALQIKDDIDSGNRVYLYSYWCNHKAYGAARLKEKYGQNVCAVSRAHRYDLYIERSKSNYIPYREYIANELDRIYSISENGYNYLCEILPSHIEKIDVAKLGTPDVDGVSEAPDNSKIHIVSCSHMVPIKRLNLLIETLSQVYFPIKWTHIGDGPLMSELKKLTEKLPNNVECVFTGNLTQHAVYELYHTEKFHFLINVSESEGIPVSIMEAMSFGIPVIATNVGGTSEIVKNGINGFLISKDFNPYDLAHMLTNNYQICDGLRNGAIDIWHNNYSAKNNYTKFFNQLINL